MKIHCDKCDTPLAKPGGLLFSPPGPDGETKKFHLCNSCYKWIRFTIGPTHTEKERKNDKRR